MIRGLIPAVCFAALALATTAGCNRPSEEDCTKAVTNIRRIYGIQGETAGVTPQAMVRSCRGSASAESVQCYIAAQTGEDLARCQGDSGGFSGTAGNAGADETAPQEKAAPSAAEGGAPSAAEGGAPSAAEGGAPSQP